MTKVILNKNKVLKNEYFFVDNLTNLKKSNSENLIVTLSQWLDNKKTLSKKKNIGIQLNSDESLSLIKEEISFFKIIQFNFLTFKDGRPFSEAKKLRVEFQYTGEVRAS